MESGVELTLVVELLAGAPGRGFWETIVSMLRDENGVYIRTWDKSSRKRRR
jgi:hypothetical protein